MSGEIKAEGVRYFKAKLEAGMSRDRDELEFLMPGSGELVDAIINLAELVAIDLEEGREEV